VQYPDGRGHGSSPLLSPFWVQHGRCPNKKRSSKPFSFPLPRSTHNPHHVFQFRTLFSFSIPVSGWFPTSLDSNPPPLSRKLWRFPPFLFYLTGKGKQFQDFRDVFDFGSAHFFLASNKLSTQVLDFSGSPPSNLPRPGGPGGVFTSHPLGP